MSGLLAEPRAARMARLAVAIGIAAAVHAAPLALAMRNPPEEVSLEEAGAMVIEFAEVAVAPDSEASHAAAAEDSPDTPEVAEVEEKRSAKAAEELPTAEASPEKPPEPDLLVAQQQTMEKTEEAADTQTTEAAEAQQAASSAVAAPDAIETPTLEATAELPGAPKEGTVEVSAAKAIESWQKLVMTALGKEKRYPRDSRRNHEEGDVEVRVVIDRAGRVLESEVRRPTRFALLNSEALEMVRRAAPLPAPPRGVFGERVELVLPIRFRLK